MCVSLMLSCSAPATPPTLVHVYHLFGPTHPGEFDPDRLEFSLRYNVRAPRARNTASRANTAQGVLVVFRIPAQFRDFCAARQGTRRLS
jgi:hypothetical protein